jgi:hypothetical protein
MKKKKTLEEFLKNYVQGKGTVAKNHPPVYSENGEKLFFDDQGYLIKLYHEN